MSNFINIVYFLTFLDSQTGGMERQALQLARKLQDQGCNIFFITCAHFKKMRREKLAFRGEFNGFKIYRIPFVKGWRRLNAVIYFLGGLILLLARRNKYQIIHAHQLHTSGIVACAVKYILRSKRVVIKNCCSGIYGDILNLGKIPCGQKLIKRLNKATDCFIAISKETEIEMVKAKLNSIVRIPNGVDSEKFIPVSAMEKDLLQQELLGADRKKKIVLFAGKFDPQKNIFILLEAMTLIKQDVLLLIIGEGQLRVALEKYVQDHKLGSKVKFLGCTNEIVKFYQIADVFVLPSHAEGMPNVLLEAMSCGISVVGSSIEGICDLINNGINGYLFEKDDVQDLVQRLEFLMKEQKHAQAIGQNARKAIVENFCLGVVVQKYMKLYKNLIVVSCDK